MLLCQFESLNSKARWPTNIRGKIRSYTNRFQHSSKKEIIEMGSEAISAWLASDFKPFLQQNKKDCFKVTSNIFQDIGQRVSMVASYIPLFTSCTTSLIPYTTSLVDFQQLCLRNMLPHIGYMRGKGMHTMFRERGGGILLFLKIHFRHRRCHKQDLCCESYETNARTQMCSTVNKRHWSFLRIRPSDLQSFSLQCVRRRIHKEQNGHLSGMDLRVLRSCRRI